MRRILSVLVLTFMFSVVAVAQETIRFMDIPVDGNYKSFIEKLQEKGFKLDPNQSPDSAGFSFFMGEYEGRNSNVEVVWSAKSGAVYQVNVGYRARDKRYVRAEINELCVEVQKKFPGFHRMEDGGNIIYYVPDYNGCVGIGFEDDLILLSFMNMPVLKSVMEE